MRAPHAAPRTRNEVGALAAPLPLRQLVEQVPTEAEQSEAPLGSKCRLQHRNQAYYRRELTRKEECNVQS